MPGTSLALVLAQEAPAAPPAGGDGSPGIFGSIPLLLVIFVIFYFLMIRPQSKERRKREELLKAVKKHDEVVTTAGIHGEVVSISENTVKLEVADGVRIEFDRSAIWQVRKSASEGSEPEDVAEAGAAKSSEKGPKEKGRA